MLLNGDLQETLNENGYKPAFVEENKFTENPQKEQAYVRDHREVEKTRNINDVKV